ncbi:PEP-CTERM sorting domain-containing protein [Agaribacter marinus]|nr:PEP-CTERM sorting domain-containing protein [Agaribacter marinus]
MMYKSLIALLFLVTGTANATLLSFDYTFTNGSVLTGILEGTIQADSDTVVIDAFGDVSFDGVLLPSIENVDFVSISDFPAGGLDPKISFSGDVMDLFVCANGFIVGNCGFNAGGFFFDSVSFGAGAGVAAAGTVFDPSFNSVNWNLSVAEVPAPLSIVLFVLGLAFVGLTKRKQTA